jgi:hypothetical protein
MSPTRSKYRMLGIKLISLEDNRSHTPKKPSMAEEKKNNKADNPNRLMTNFHKLSNATSPARQEAHQDAY